MVRDLWWTGFAEKVNFEFRMKSGGVMDGESGEEKDGCAHCTCWIGLRVVFGFSQQFSQLLLTVLK